MESETEHKAKQLSLAGPATSIIFVATNTFFFFFVATKVSIWRQNLSRQIFFVEGAQIMFVATKHNFVSTNVLSRQAYFYRDKRHVCRNKTLS